LRIIISANVAVVGAANIVGGIGVVSVIVGVICVRRVTSKKFIGCSSSSSGLFLLLLCSIATAVDNTTAASPS
jgi:nitrate reductase gamma subunit